MNDYMDKMREVLRENGIIIFNGEEDVEFEIDSLRFISIIVQIEEVFGISIGDKYLTMEYKTLNDYVNLVNVLI